VIGVIGACQFVAKHHPGTVTYASALGSPVLAAGFGVLRAATVRIGCKLPGRGGESAG
jgi:hypothetical protein